MLYDKDIARLKAQLLSLGFENGLESSLRSQLCFQPAQFFLPVRVVKGADSIEYLLQFEFNASNGYECKYYDAVLRKNIVVESPIDLDNRMNQVDWHFIGITAADIIAREEAIDAIMTDIKKFEATEDSRQFTDLLKFKYFSGTAAENLIPNLSVLKSRYEVNQRFYFFDDELPITADEAYRFLCHRWMEKQVQILKKLGTPAASTGKPAVPESSEPIKKRKVKVRKL